MLAQQVAIGAGLLVSGPADQLLGKCSRQLPRGALNALQDLHLLQRLRLLTSSPVLLHSRLQPGRRMLPEQSERVPLYAQLCLYYVLMDCVGEERPAWLFLWSWDLVTFEGDGKVGDPAGDWTCLRGALQTLSSDPRVRAGNGDHLQAGEQGQLLHSCSCRVRFILLIILLSAPALFCV